MRDERRRQVLAAAWRCAARKRFAEMTVDDVCAEASLSKGAFYGYFDSKDELLVALLDEDSAALDRMMDEIAETETSEVERLRRFSRGMLGHADDPGRAQVRAELWAAVLAEEALRKHYSKMATQRRVRLRGWIDEGIERGELREVPANALASLLLAMADGLVLHATLNPSSFRWANIRRAIDELLVGISAK